MTAAMPLSIRLQRAWPLPALLAWGLCWALALGVRPTVGAGAAWALACALGVALAFGVERRWRRLAVAAGFPLSSLIAMPGLPGWIWLLPLLALAVLYPRRAWSDAPLFPTPAGALDELAGTIPLDPGKPVLDAGCGLGNGLRALASAWPHARIEGVEFSPLLALLAGWRCRFARVRRGDMWALSWSAYRVVYLFQRPESMAKAWRKACTEMAPQAWMVSLEFEVPGLAPERVTQLPCGRRVLAWRIPPQSGGCGADNPPVAARRSRR